MEELKRETEFQAEKNRFKSPITEESIIVFLEKETNQVIEGYTEGYKLALMVKKLEETLKTVKDKIKETVLDEVKEGYLWNGFKFEKTQSGRYSYKHSKDWTDKNSKLKDLEKAMQMSFKTGKSIIDEDTGEIYEPAIYTPNKPSYKISKSNN